MLHTPFFLQSFLLLITVFLKSHAFAVGFQESFQAALQKNESVEQSGQLVEQAHEQVRQARGAVAPKVFLNASHQWQDQPSDPFARQFSPAQQDSASINVKQPIFSGLREFAGYRQRQQLLESARNDSVLTQVKLYQNVGTAYFNILAHEQDLRNLKEQVELYTQRVKDLQRRTQRGESNVTEALTAQSTQASLEAEIQLVTGQLATARQNFAFLTGLPSDSPLKDEAMQGPQLQRPLLPMEQYLERVEQRPDIRGAAQKATAALEGVKIAKGAHWPTIEAQGNYYIKRPVQFLDDIKWDAQVNVSMPIFEGGIRRAQVREAAAMQSNSDLELARLRRQARQEIQTFYESLRVRLGQVAALEKTVGLAERNYKELQREFRNGLVRSIDAQVALTEFRMARRTFDQARYAAQIDFVGLEAASFMIPHFIQQGAR